MNPQTLIIVVQAAVILRQISVKAFSEFLLIVFAVHDIVCFLPEILKIKDIINTLISCEASRIIPFFKLPVAVAPANVSKNARELLFDSATHNSASFLEHKPLLYTIPQA